MNSDELQAMMLDPAKFREALGIHPDPWQDLDFRSLDPSWQHAVGIPITDAGVRVHQRAWLTRPRGHSKTTDTATMICWALLSAPRRRTGVMAAASKDQAGLLRTAAEQLIRNHDWLSDFLEVQAWSIINRKTDSRCDVLSSSESTSWGLLIDFCAADEVTVWSKPELWYSLLSAVAKKAHAHLQVISNAGFSGSVWEPIYQQIAAPDSGWYVHALPGPLASWISPAALAEQERLLPRIVYERLWLNLWTTGEGSAVSDEDLKAATTLTGPRRGNPDGGKAVAGLDIGVRNDHSALCVLTVPRGVPRIQLAHTRSWKPPRGGEVDLQAVEDEVFRCHREYRLSACYFDPAQAYHIAQRLRKRGVRMIEMPFVQKNLEKMARALMMTFRDKRVDLYHEPQLFRDLRSLQIEENLRGLRLTAVTTADGSHCDLGVAYSIAIAGAEMTADAQYRGFSSWGGLITPSTRGLSTTRSDDGYQGWKFEQHLNALQGAGVEVLASPYRTVGGEPAPDAAEHLRGNE